MTGFIGILMLDTAFERIPGDAGNPESYHRPARTRIVPYAGSTDIVRNGLPGADLIEGFRAAAQSLEAEGAVALTSTCGFLITLQQQISAAVTIPVMLSALSLFPVIRTAHANRPIGILTASATSLGPQMLRSAGIDPAQTHVAGMEDCAAFSSAILVPKANQPKTIDRHAIGHSAVAKSVALCRSHPEIAAILLECGNLPPWADAITTATGKPVYSILDTAKLIAP